MKIDVFFRLKVMYVYWSSMKLLYSNHNYLISPTEKVSSELEYL